MAAIEANRLLCGDYLAHHSRNPRENFGRRIEGDVGIERDPSIELPFVVPDAALQQLTVQDDDLLTADAAQPRGLQPDPLDGSLRLIDRNGVTDIERLVEHDRECGEEIAENVLYGERDGDAANAEP